MRNEIILSSLFLILLIRVGIAYADCIKNQNGEVVCGEGPCAKDQYGEVYCAAFGGGILRDQNGELKCGIGECARDSNGIVWCSKVQGGGAAKDSNGEVKCFDGCNKGSSDNCFIAK